MLNGKAWTRIGSTHGPIRLPEPVHPTLCVLELVGGQLHLVDLHDGIPQLLVLFLQHNHHASGLGVEGAGNMLDRVGDELFDAGVGDGRLVGQLVVGAAGLGCIEEVLGVGHDGCCCGKLSLKRWLLMLLFEGRRRRGGGEQGRRKNSFIVGQDPASGIDEWGG